MGPIPITTPPRALLEAAPLVSDEVLEELVDSVIDRHLATPSSILGAIRRSVTGRGRAGAPRLREALRPWLEGIQPGSPAETRLLRHLADRGLPPPVRQHRLALPGGSVAVLDLAWPRAMAALEYDGARWHGPRQLGADIAREERLRALGWWLGRADRHDLAPSSTRLVQELTPRLACLAA